MAVSVAFALTGEWRTALAIGMIEPLFQTLAYAAHERAWMRLQARRVFAGTGGARARSRVKP